MTTKTKRELIQFTQAQPGIMPLTAFPDLSTWQSFLELYRYQVPVGKELSFAPGHTFALAARGQTLQPVNGAVLEDTPVLTWEAAEANDPLVAMTLLPAVPAVDDAYYFGWRYPLDGIRIEYSVAANEITTYEVEYWNGAAWVAVAGLVDPSNCFQAAAGTYDITWTRPGNWAENAVLGTTMYWVRFRVTAIGVPTGATGTQAWINPPPAADMANFDKVRIEVRSQNELSRTPLIERALYSQVTEFTDKDQMCRLDIGEQVVASGGQWLVILVQAEAPVNGNLGYFVLTCDRTRQGII